MKHGTREHTHTSYLQISKQQQSECTIQNQLVDSMNEVEWSGLKWNGMKWIGVRTNKSHYRLN